MAQFICEKQGRCCPHEFYDSIEQAISDSEDGVPCDHLVEVAHVRHGRWEPVGIDSVGCVGRWRCTACKMTSLEDSNYCPKCGAKMDLEG